MPREDQGEIAWGNVLRQHANSPVMEGFYRSFYGPLTTAATGLDAIAGGRTLDDAEGARLDLMGSIVGISRDIPNGIYLAFFGYAEQPAGRAYGVARYRAEGEPTATTYTAADAEYRSMIRAKIALNNGHGTAPDIAAALRHIFKVDQVSVRDVGVAHIEAWIGRIPSPDDHTGDIIKDLIPRAAGVGIDLVYFAPQSFGYEGQPGATGYNQGPYAREASGNLNPL